MKLFSIINKLVRFPIIASDYFAFLSMDKSKRFSVPFYNINPQIKDKTEITSFDRHYIYHPAWAARILARTKPEVHVDISSILCFSTIASAFVPVKFYDYRPADLQLSNLDSESADLLRLPFEDSSIKSLSCMHTVEHVGLGRYGDPLDPDGDLKAMKELARVLAVDGNLLLVVPVGQPKIYFNAHRVYSYDQIISGFFNLSLKEFSLIPEKSGPMIINATATDVAKEKYACGCFWFSK